jgi:sulfur carrier protein ThiS
MQTAELHPKGMLKEYIGGQACIEIPSGIPLREALIICGIPPDLVAIAFIDQNTLNKEEIIPPGVKIELVAVIGGG